jgi:1-aminocyclopropane-1-carboxylate deaminase
MEEINIQNSVVQEIHLKVLNDQNNKLFIKRDDLIHPYISGNKWRKLNYNVALCKESSFHGIITYGGAYSNHVIACAAACQLNKLKSIAYIRGEELNSTSNKVLRKCEELGMELIFMKRPEFDAMKKVDKTVQVNHETFLSIPEGGANLNGILGCMEILAETDNDYDIIIPRSKNVQSSSSSLIENIKEISNNNTYILLAILAVTFLLLSSEKK